MNCEFCGKDCKGEFGDLHGSIVCGKCLGWYGDDIPAEVQAQIDLQESIDLGDRAKLEEAFGCDFPDL